MSDLTDTNQLPSPPAYEVLYDGDSLTSANPPPRYSRRPISGCSTIHTQISTKEFTYREGMTILTVEGDASLSKEIPTVMEGGKIAGRVKLRWKKGQEIKSVTIRARGRIIIGSGKDKANDVYTFLNMPIHLWTKHMGRLYPTNPTTYERQWSFSIPLPKEIAVSDGGPGHSIKTFRLPHSFTEATSPARVVYDLVVQIRRKAWHRDSRFATQFAYCQGNRPHSVPLSRTISDEISGWKASKPVVLRGKLFRGREAEVEYSLSFATPMCYNLGSSIYLFLVIKSQDTEALDILAKPESIIIRLERRVRYRNVQMHAARSVRWLSAVDQLELAVWKPTRRPQEPTKRFMRGTLDLEDGLCPSFNILNVAVEIIEVFNSEFSSFRMDVLSSPPPYIHSHRAGQVPRSRDFETLPRYTRRNTIAQPLVRREPTEHVFQLVDGRRSWAVLRLLSSAKSTKSIPTFYEQEKITGTLEVDTEKGDSSIRMITIEITGRVVASARVEDIHTFLTLTHPVWSKTSDGSSSGNSSGPKLVGRNVWPISIALPRTINGLGESYKLPETFRDMSMDVTVQYELTVHIARGKLRADDRIRATFGYVPSSRPGPPSEIRQLANEQNLPIPGPHIDPLGWSISRIAIARGVVLRSRHAEIHCTLSLAMPLCYTRGSSIPCFLKLSGRDAQALDGVSNPNSIQLTLRRTVKYHIAASFGKSAVSWKECSKDICTGSWWHSRNLQSDPHNRYFEGSIKLPKDLRPSSKLEHFSISYFVDLYPFDTAGFSTLGEGEPMLSEPVEIATMHPKGHNAPSPPAYDHRPRPSDDFHAI
ncbi:hypothetical protein V5O48_002427 [Marasmius crinis-equi]|uniref:Arrestin-like N-terminal domain-containing protein n=1 Tax=Marasmius crinis-equi TaxID=585013 RepID=A0ABR3FVS7_9AGAR